GLLNAAVDPLKQPSRYGLFAACAGPGLTPPLPSDIQPSPAFQFQDFIPLPPFLNQSPQPRPILLLHARLDPNSPNIDPNVITAPQIIFITNGGNINIPGGSINLPIELPNLELRSINTTVTIPDNGTMLFSGLINDRKYDAKAGVPFFSDLPIIGRLFATNQKE